MAEPRAAIELYDLLNQTRAAQVLNVHRATVWRWIKEGKVQTMIVGGLRMIPQSEIDRLKRENEAAG